MKKIFSRSKKNENENKNEELCEIDFSLDDLSSIAAACVTVANALKDGNNKNILEAAHLLRIASKIVRAMHE